PDKSCIWEEVSTFNQKTYRNFDHMIDWFDHSTVHFQHSVDITDLKKASFEASYDELTGIYNRRSGKTNLEDSILEAKTNEKNIVVVLYDLDNLKLTNDLYGHVQGDHMLRCIADEVKKNLREQDVFFRLSGDEFVIGMYDCSTSVANERMRKILHLLKKRTKHEHLKYQLSFCYGLYKVTPDNFLSTNDIITKTDEKMYEWKKKSHLKQAFNNMKNDDFLKKENFDYNKDLLYDALVKSTDDYIFICNMKTGVFRYTPAMVEEFDFPNEVLHNAAAVFGSKIHKDDKYEFLNSNQQITDGKTDSHIVEYRALNKNNEWVWLRCHGHVEYDDEQEPAIFAGFISNLGKKNYRDILTSLYNKFEFEKRITEAQGEFSIMLLNIDDFKTLNNLYNREFGDNVLRIVGQNLQTILSKEADVFKLDGDEFGLFIKKSDNPNILNLIFEKIQAFVEQQHICDNHSFVLSITAGGVVAPQDGTTYLELLKNCEMTLQYGKHNHRGKLSIFNKYILKEKTYQIQLIHVLKQDISHNYQNFSLVFQPIIETTTNQICKVETLCRWTHPHFKNISPGIFIPLLEETGDIIKLGKWIFEQSVIHLKQLLECNPHISMSINISNIQIMEDDFSTFIEETILYYNVPFESVILELTETAIAKNAHKTIDTIHQLRMMGIRIAMDDFGTGYSSLSLLKNEPLDIIKIDQSFVRGLHDDSFNQAFIKLIIELCHQINLLVLIEGVETKEELDLLLPLLPDFIQGYYTGMPMKHDELLNLIKKEC
ncbi:MAG: EAL domain-containing protein, partial [Coprobacillus sp.]